MSVSNENIDQKPEKWSEEKTVRLIRAFRSKPVLWDTKNDFYFKKAAKPVLWEEIASEVNSCPAVCKNKIVNLMSGFRREKAKTLRRLANLSSNKIEDMEYKLRCGWYAFQELGFLLYKDAERNRINSGQSIDADTDFANLKQALLAHVTKMKGHSTDSSDGESQDATEVKHVISSSTKSEPRSDWAIKPASPSSEDIEEEPYICEDSIDSPEPGTSRPTPVKIKRKISTSDNHEEITYFANFIASKIKHYSEVTKNAVQKEICQIIFKADMNYYETIASDSDFIVFDPLDGPSQSKKSRRQ